MMKWACLLVPLATTAAGSAAAQSTAWERSFDKNTEFTGTMTPRNDSLAIFCAVGGHASIVLKAPVFRTTVADKHTYSVVFAIDGERRELVMTAHDEDLIFEGADLNARSQIEQFIDALSQGKSLTAAGQKIHWRANFSLDGAKDALEGILTGC